MLTAWIARLLFSLEFDLMTNGSGEGLKTVGYGGFAGPRFLFISFFFMSNDTMS